jgi:hypothetical protein
MLNRSFKSVIELSNKLYSCYLRDLALIGWKPLRGCSSTEEKYAWLQITPGAEFIFF